MLLAKHAPNKANGVKLIEWLAGEKAQQIYADANYEYPIRAGVAVNPTIAGYGKLNADPLPIVEDRRQPQGGLDAGGQGRLRQLIAFRMRRRAWRSRPRSRASEGKPYALLASSRRGLT